MAIDSPDDSSYQYQTTPYDVNNLGGVGTTTPSVNLGSINVTGTQPQPDYQIGSNNMNLGGGTGSNGLDLGGLLKGYGLNDQNVSQLISLLGAGNNFQNANQYMDLAGKYAQQMDPYGAQRPYWQQEQKNLYEDPQKYLESNPFFTALRNQGQGAVARTQAAAGNLNQGRMSTALDDYTNSLAGNWINQQQNYLGQNAGSQIGPGAAANLITHGIDASVAARNNALTNLTKAMFPNATPNGSLDPNAISTIRSLLNSGANNPQDIVKALQSAGLSNQQISEVLGGGGGIGGGSLGTGNGPLSSQGAATPYQGPQPDSSGNVDWTGGSGIDQGSWFDTSGNQYGMDSSSWDNIANLGFFD